MNQLTDTCTGKDLYLFISICPLSHQDLCICLLFDSLYHSQSLIWPFNGLYLFQNQGIWRRSVDMSVLGLFPKATCLQFALVLSDTFRFRMDIFLNILLPVYNDFHNPKHSEEFLLLVN